MRIALISDIHGNVLALDAVLEDIARHRIDRVFDLGDRVSGPLWPRETFERLDGLRVPGVRGNHDRIVGEDAREALGPSDLVAHDALDAGQRGKLGALAFSIEIVPGFLAFHARPDHDDRALLDDVGEGQLRRAEPALIQRRLGAAGSALVAVGHSHRPDMVRLPNGTLVINPGSVGCPAYADDGETPHVSEAGTPHARYAIVDLTAGIAVPDITFRAIRYDWGRAAAQAARNARPEWAHALEFGLMPRLA